VRLTKGVYVGGDSSDGLHWPGVFHWQILYQITPDGTLKRVDADAFDQPQYRRQNQLYNAPARSLFFGEQLRHPPRGQ
jgi:hypothetical protein